MGLHPDLKHIVLEVLVVAAPHCVGTKATVEFKGAPAASADIVDYLTYWKGMNTDRKYTLLDIQNFFWRSCFRGNAFTFIVVDDKRNVPTLKKATQDDRIVAANKTREKQGKEKALPYDYDVEFNMLGATWTEFIEATEGEESAQEVTEKICLERMNKSCAAVKLRLWEAIHDSLPHRMADLTSTLPRQCRVVFDYDNRKMQMHTSHPSDDVPSVIDLRVERSLGEADLALMYFVHTLETNDEFEAQKLYAKHQMTSLGDACTRGDSAPDITHIHLQTTDSDAMATYAFYHGKRTNRNRQNVRILWHTRNGPNAKMRKQMAVMQAESGALVASAAAAPKPRPKFGVKSKDKLPPKEAAKSKDEAEHFIVDLARTMEYLCKVHYHKKHGRRVPSYVIGEGMLLGGHDMLQHSEYAFGFGMQDILDTYVDVFMKERTVELSRLVHVKPSMNRFKAFVVKLWSTTLKPSHANHTVCTLRVESAKQTVRKQLEDDRKPPEKKRKTPIVDKFPSDEQVFIQGCKWLWICEYYDLACFGRRPELTFEQLEQRERKRMSSKRDRDSSGSSGSSSSSSSAEEEEDEEADAGSKPSPLSDDGMGVQAMDLESSSAEEEEEDEPKAKRRTFLSPSASATSASAAQPPIVVKSKYFA